MARLRAATFALSFAITVGAGLTESQAAQVTSVLHFFGTHSETWERFGVSHIPSGTSILGGIATISGDHMVTAGAFQMCSVIGRPSDGKILMDSDRPSGPLTISFSQPVSAFGAYWGSGVDCFGDPPSILTFQDVNGNVIGSDSFRYDGSGALLWRGYRFGSPVKTITRIAKDGQEGVALDGLQAIVASSGAHLAWLYNISTRGFVQTGNNIIIGGVIISGSGPKEVLLRVLGPTLGQAPFNLSNALTNPTLDLFQGSTRIASNDDWGTAANKQAIIDTGMAPPNSLESAILISLNPGAYTAIIHGVNNTTGNALFEAYGLDNTAGSKFGNISTRGFVQTGSNVMIAGVIVHGLDNENVLIRALGPTLGQPPFNVPNALPNPFLDLRDSNGTRITSNDNWKDTQASEIQATGRAPPNDAESAIVTTLAPGNYTTIVTGVNSTTGNALVEVYSLN